MMMVANDKPVYHRTTHNLQLQRKGVPRKVFDNLQHSEKVLVTYKLTRKNFGNVGNLSSYTKIFHICVILFPVKLQDANSIQVYFTDSIQV